MLLIFGSAKSFKTDNVLLKLLRDCLLTLNDFQKLLVDINWICPHLKLTSVDLKPFVWLLKNNNPNPSSKKKLTSVTQLTFVKVNEALNDQLIKINIAKKGD